MTHFRVIPRDFFNEAKLLKCLGQLELIINHTGPNELGLKSDHDGNAFEICQNPDDASLYVSNYYVTLNGETLSVFTAYNSKDNYPLYCTYQGETYSLLDENGKLNNFLKKD